PHLAVVESTVRLGNKADFIHDHVAFAFFALCATSAIWSTAYAPINANSAVIYWSNKPMQWALAIKKTRTTASTMCPFSSFALKVSRADSQRALQTYCCSSS
ncbi:uncharacterized protein METZ01_LOCUS440206, partial [marine metagenome]